MFDSLIEYLFVSFEVLRHVEVLARNIQIKTKPWTVSQSFEHFSQLLTVDYYKRSDFLKTDYAYAYRDQW